MNKRKNGLIGGIRNVYLRRLALVFLGIPFMTFGMAGALIATLPLALRDAVEAFADTYGEFGRPFKLLALTVKATWSRTWEPVE